MPVKLPLTYVTDNFNNYFLQIVENSIRLGGAETGPFQAAAKA